MSRLGWKSYLQGWPEPSSLERLVKKIYLKDYIRIIIIIISIEEFTQYEYDIKVLQYVRVVWTLVPATLTLTTQ